MLPPRPAGTSVWLLKCQGPWTAWLCFSPVHFQALGLWATRRTDSSPSWVKGSCAAGLTPQEGKEHFLSGPQRTSCGHALPALLAQTLVAAPPGGNRQPLLETAPHLDPKGKGLGLDSGRAGTGVSPGGVTPSGPADCCPEEYRPCGTREFGFSGQARKLPIEKKEAKQNQRDKPKKTGGEPERGAASGDCCGEDETLRVVHPNP